MKKLITLITLIAFVLLIASCNNGESESSKNSVSVDTTQAK